MLYCSAGVGEGEKDRDAGESWPMLCLAEACTCCTSCKMHFFGSGKGCNKHPPGKIRVVWEFVLGVELNGKRLICMLGLFRVLI